MGHITSLLKTFSSPELNKPMLETTDHGSRVTWDGTAQAVWFTQARVQLWSPLFCTAGNTNVCSAVWARSLQKHRSSTGWRWSNWSKLNESGWQPGAEVAAADRSCWEADSLCRSQCCTHTLAHTLTFKHRHTPTHTRIQAPTHTHSHTRIRSYRILCIRTRDRPGLSPSTTSVLKEWVLVTLVRKIVAKWKNAVFGT